MKKKIHPDYNDAATVTCACGQTYTIGSTKKSMSVELCSNCHPFYTGKQKIVDSARRVEKFKARAKKQKDEVLDHAAKKKKRTERAKRRAEQKAKAENKKALNA